MAAGGFCIEPEWRGALAAAGLDRAALARGEIGRVVQRKPGREVRRVELGGAHPALYVKRIRSLGVRARLNALRGRDSATLEARELERIARANVAAARPVAYGRIDLGLCVIATEEIRGDDLTRALERAAPREKRRLLRASGELLARLHAAGIFHEVRSKDVIVAEGGELALIDRDPKDGLPFLARAAQGAWLCLARCEYLRLRGGARLSDRDRLRVLAAYCAAAPTRPRLAFALPLVRSALARELERHRADAALLAEFGPLAR